MARDSLARPLRAVVAVALVGWLAIGGIGSYLYVHRYWLYRGFPPPVTPKGIARGKLMRIHFYSPALRHQRSYLVYLPPGYAAQAAAGHRFPVLYLLHAPPGRPDGFLKAGAADVDLNVMLAHHRVRPMLLVIPYGKSGTFGNDTEWANARAGRYEDFVLDVVHSVDRRFATLRRRQDRGIAGLSEGGYGAINIALHHLRMFSVAQSWSGYFVQTPTASFAGATPAQLRANSPGLYVGSLAPTIRRLGFRAYLYQGVKDEIRPFRIRRFAAQLRQAGAYVRWGFFPGGHDWGLWRHQMRHMLRVASLWFGESPRIRHPAPAGGLGHPERPRAGHPNPCSPHHRPSRHDHAVCRRRQRPVGTSTAPSPISPAASQVAA